MSESAPQRRSHTQRTDESDRLMLAAAIELINLKGPDQTTLKEVGERAGYSRGLAGYRFGSKQGLFEFVMRSVGEQWLEQLATATLNKSGIEAMQAAVSAHSTICQQGQAAVRAFYMLWLHSVSPHAETSSLVHNIDQRRQRDVAQWIREARTPAPDDRMVNAMAAQFSATIIGIVYHWLSAPDDLKSLTAQHEQLIYTMTQFMRS